MGIGLSPNLWFVFGKLKLLGLKGATMLYIISFILGSFVGMMLTCIVVSGKDK